MFILDRLVHCEGSAWTEALNEATPDDLLAALARPDLVARRRWRIIDALRIAHGIDARDESADALAGQATVTAMAPGLFGVLA